MKKYLFIIFIIITLMYVKPVSAKIITVCGSECDYDTLDEAFDALEGEYDWSTIYIDASVQYELKSDHTITGPFTIAQLNYYSDEDEEADIVINGNNHTIHFSWYIELEPTRNLTIKNLNFVFDGDVNSLNGGGLLNVYNGELGNGRKVNDIELSNVTISSTRDFSNCGNRFIAGFQFEFYGNALFRNVKISNLFYGATAWTSDDSDVVFDHCDFEDTFISIESYGKGVYINDSKLSRFVFAEHLDVEPDFQPELVYHFKNTNLKTKVVSFELFDDIFEDNHYYKEKFCNDLKDKAIYYAARNVENYHDLYIDVQNEFVINNKKSIDDLLSLFTENTDGFIITSSDPKIAKVIDKNVTFLKSGDVTITVENPETHEYYVAKFHVNLNDDNPKTGQSIITIILVILLVVGFSYLIKRSKKNE